MPEAWLLRRSECGGYTLMTAGAEVHVDLHRRGVVSRRTVREALLPVLREFGFATTRVERSDNRSRRFVEAIGFRPTWSDETYHYYMLAKEPFVKER